MGQYRDLAQTAADALIAWGDQLDADLGDVEPTPPPTDRVLSGVYTGDSDGDASAEQEFAAWRHREPEVVLTFTPDDTWSSSWWAGQFGGDYPYRDRLIITRGLCLKNESVDTPYPEGAFADWARAVQGAGIVDPIWRLGHEANGGWYAWTVWGHEHSYAQRFDQAAREIRSVTPNARICWCLAAGQSLDGFDYPSEVDLLGVDTYDVYNQSETWPDYVALAADFGVPLCVPEWGLWADDGSGGHGDNPAFIDEFADWAGEACVGGHEAYFNKDSSSLHRLDHYPEGAGRYLARFGG